MTTPLAELKAMDECQDCIDDKCRVHCWRCNNNLNEIEKNVLNKENICTQCGVREYK